MRTFIVWTTALVVLVFFSACVFSSEEAPKPPAPPVLKLRLIVPATLSGVVGKRDTLTPKLAPDTGRQHQLFGFTSSNVEIAPVSSEGEVQYLGIGVTSIITCWSDGTTSLAETTLVTVTAPATRIFTFRLALIEGDPEKNPTDLTITLAWRRPTRDSVVGRFAADGTVSLPVLASVADQMDSVTTRIQGSDGHFVSSQNFMRINVDGSMHLWSATKTFTFTVPGVITPVAAPEIAFVAIPKQFQVPAGLGAGTLVSIPLEGLFRKTADGSSYVGNGLAFSKTSLPKTFCFDRRGTNHNITVEDSTIYAGTFADVNARLGVEAFRLVPFGPECLKPIQTNDTLSFPRAGDTVYIPRSPTYMRDSTDLKEDALKRFTQVELPHELFHTLGFGHSCAVPTIMAFSCYENASDTLTSMDVAVFHFMRQVQIASASIAGTGSGGALALPAAYQASDVSSLGKK